MKDFIGFEPDEVLTYNDDLGKMNEDERIANGTAFFEGEEDADMSKGDNHE